MSDRNVPLPERRPVSRTVHYHLSVSEEELLALLRAAGYELPRRTRLTLREVNGGRGVGLLRFLDAKWSETIPGAAAHEPQSEKLES